MQYCIKTNFYSCARIFCEIPNIPNVSRNAPASFVSLVIYFSRNLHLNIENQLLRTSSSQIDREIKSSRIKFGVQYPWWVFQWTSYLSVKLTVNIVILPWINQRNIAFKIFHCKKKPIENTCLNTEADFSFHCTCFCINREFIHNTCIWFEILFIIWY